MSTSAARPPNPASPSRRASVRPRPGHLTALPPHPADEAENSASLDDAETAAASTHGPASKPISISSVRPL
ncbi:hypothetical protein ACTU3I_07980 [Microbacterium sp. RD1]|uniref:hypothetical protein n=1 Tax=Microbacterium sp. RD1 TaxID=3457313 RepID=UPI003FA5B2ED